MTVSEAIVTFSQSEKIKSGLIWVSLVIEMREGIAPEHRSGTGKLLEALVGMLGHEVHVTRNVTSDQCWIEAEKSINMALVMIRSKVPQEATFHLTNALSQVTSLGNRAMVVLKKEKELL